LATKGTTRTGETYCMSCYQLLQDAEVQQCPGCMSTLEGEVKAFLCPKCKQVIALGEPQCPKCGLKFKVRTVKPKETKEDDRFLMKLIEWGKSPEDQAGSEKAEGGPPPVETDAPETPSRSDENLRRLAELKASVRDLVENRSEMLSRMEQRMEAEKYRLAEISAMDPEKASSEQIEAEIMALADEMADITMLQAHMESLSDEITTLMGSVEVSDATKERGLAAKALRMKLDAKEKELAELKAREEQLANKEQMVDRKIQAYANKKKQLDQEEEALKLRLVKLEEERAELERLKGIATGAKSDSERDEARAAWLEEQKNLKKRVLGMKSAVTSHRTGTGLTEDEIEAAEGDLGNIISDLETQIAGLITEKIDIQKSISEATVVDEDMKRLLKVLDQLLGQLPEEAVERFSKSEEFSIYERVLDRLKL
jgi:DNA repair exonuclease SbcCD ATPase subunit